MKYYGTVISVEDIKASRKFYEDMFGLVVYQDYGRNISFVGGLSLMQDFDWLVKVPKEKVMKQSNNMELYFEEEDFDGFVKKLRQYPNIRCLHEVLEQPWGQRAIRFYDPDCHIIEVGEDMKAVINRFLASGLSMEGTAKRMNVTVKDLEILLGG
jgi:catechol 2,3-dioxygenase-like lactoylglutathione lyase family enzyme